MKHLLLLGLLSASALGEAADRFPSEFADGVRYAVVERGGIREELYVGQSSIDAVKNGQSLPAGTVITLVDYREGRLFRFVTMTKREKESEASTQEGRLGDWQFQAFNADRSVNRRENLSRCVSCHRPQERTDFVFTLDLMRAVN